MNGQVFFEALDDASRAALVAAGRMRRYPKGSLLFAAGDDANEVVIVRSGAVKVVAGALSGREVILDVLHAGEVLGELSAVDGGTRSATVFALEPCEVLAVSQREFLRLVHEHGVIAVAPTRAAGWSSMFRFLRTIWPTGRACRERRSSRACGRCGRWAGSIPTESGLWCWTKRRLPCAQSSDAILTKRRVGYKCSPVLCRYTLQ